MPDVTGGLREGRGLEQICIELPGDGPIDEEAVFAKPLGSDLYEVRSIPLFTTNIAFGDIVLATEADEGPPPVLRKVVKRSGHRSLLVHFQDGVTLERQGELLAELRLYRVSYQRGGPSFVLLDLEPESEDEIIGELLDEWTRDGLLQIEDER